MRVEQLRLRFCSEFSDFKGCRECKCVRNPAEIARKHSNVFTAHIEKLDQGGCAKVKGPNSCDVKCK